MWIVIMLMVKQISFHLLILSNINVYCIFNSLENLIIAIFSSFRCKRGNIQIFFFSHSFYYDYIIYIYIHMSIFLLTFLTEKKNKKKSKIYYSKEKCFFLRDFLL